MKILNKFLSVLCIMALLFQAVPAHAQTSPTLYFTNNTVTIGGSSAYCFFQMKNAENISAMDYRILYDADNLEFSHIYNTGFTSQADVTVSVNSSEPGVIHVTLISQNGLNGSNYLNLMYFKATADAKPGVYPITVVVTDIFNTSLETVEAITQSGTMTVKEAASAVKGVSFSNAVSSASLTVGETTDYILSASSLNNLSAGSYEFIYDETKLKLNDVVLSSAMQGTFYDINSLVNGYVKISFASEKAITSGYELVTLKFSAIAPGTAEIAFKPCDLYDYEFAGMSGNALSCSVTITEPEIAVDYPDFKIVLPPEIHSDKQFTAEVYLEGQSKVRAGDFAVKYDSSVIECLGVSGNTPGGCWVVTDKNFSDGQVRFSLVSDKDIDTDFSLVSITFKSKQNVASKSAVTLSGSQVYDAYFNAVTLEYIGAELKVIRPEYTVNFYEEDGETPVFTQKVMSGNSAIAPAVADVKVKDGENHLRFAGWDKDYSVILQNTDVVAVYTDEKHTEIVQKGVEPTCTADGISDGKFCVVCNDILAEQTVIPANGHTEAATPDVAPGYDTPGYFGGTHCGVCGTVIKSPQQADPTGPKVYAVLGSDKTLTVWGGLSETAAAQGSSFVVIYDSPKNIIGIINITDQNQSDFAVTVQNMEYAHTVKVFRWGGASLKPLYAPAEAVVTTE